MSRSKHNADKAFSHLNHIYMAKVVDYCIALSLLRPRLNPLRSVRKVSAYINRMSHSLRISFGEVDWNMNEPTIGSTHELDVESSQ
jgi:hypothetical protein